MQTSANPPWVVTKIFIRYPRTHLAHNGSKHQKFHRSTCLEITCRALRTIIKCVKSVKRLAVTLTRWMNRFPFKKFLYWVLYRTAEYCLKAIIFLVPRIPPRLLVLMTSAIVRLTFAILWPYRKLMKENVSMAMSDQFLSAARRKTLARVAWRNFVQGLFETACALDSSKDRICASVAIEGEEYLKRASEKGKGVIALGAHLGNFTMIGPRVAAVGY